MDSGDAFDLDNLAEEAQPRKSPRGTIILWLVAASWIILLIPLYLFSTTVRGEVVRQEANLQAVSESLATVNAPAPELQELTDELARVQGAASDIEAAYSILAASHTNWPAVMAAIGSYNPSQLALTSIAQSGNRITLNGRAIDDTAVIAYSQALEQSGLFSRVIVQSVMLIATPFASPTSATVAPSGTPLTPTATVTPTATLTPTPNPVDAYEVDDFTPKPIFLGQAQSHNFYPVYDVDRVKFLAKARRYYRVSTADLAPGVDTFLTVIVGSNTYINDDREPGALSSEVTFLVGGSDVETIVKVTNRGEYGPDSYYQITVEEIVPTPTPTPSVTPTPSATPTPTPTGIPTPSATPTNTPTPTPDLRDEYEPDDTTPKPIALDVTQKHNFFPDNDVDKVEFLAKVGRYYRVFTSGLEPGVDTVLTVVVGGNTYINDDRENGPPGDLSSEIVFQAGTTDVNALVSVTNRRQYGPDQWYQVTVEEITPPPTLTPTSTPTPTPTETPTPASSSSRPPGVASQDARSGPVDPARGHSLSAINAGQAGMHLRYAVRAYGEISDMVDSEAVGFVIVLELSAEAP